MSNGSATEARLWCWHAPYDTAVWCGAWHVAQVGTLTYMAPEVLVNRDGKYDGKTADIW